MESPPMGGRDRCTLCIYFRKRLCWGLESSGTYCLVGAAAVASHITGACSEASLLRPGRDIVWVSLGGKFTADVVRDLQTLSAPLQALVQLRLGCAFLRPCHRLSDACALATSRAHETATLPLQRLTISSPSTNVRSFTLVQEICLPACACLAQQKCCPSGIPAGSSHWFS